MQVKMVKRNWKEIGAVEIAHTHYKCMYIDTILLSKWMQIQRKWKRSGSIEIECRFIAFFYLLPLVFYH